MRVINFRLLTSHNAIILSSPTEMTCSPSCVEASKQNAGTPRLKCATALDEPLPKQCGARQLVQWNKFAVASPVILESHEKAFLFRAIIGIGEPTSVRHQGGYAYDTND